MGEPSGLEMLLSAYLLSCGQDQRCLLRLPCPRWAQQLEGRCNCEGRRSASFLGAPFAPRSLSRPSIDVKLTGLGRWLRCLERRQRGTEPGRQMSAEVGGKEARESTCLARLEASSSVASSPYPRVAKRNETNNTSFTRLRRAMRKPEAMETSEVPTLYGIISIPLRVAEEPRISVGARECGEERRREGGREEGSAAEREGQTRR